MIVTAVPGEPVPGLQLSAQDKQEVHLAGRPAAPPPG